MTAALPTTKSQHGLHLKYQEGPSHGGTDLEPALTHVPKLISNPGELPLAMTALHSGALLLL